jgi:peptidoglycan/LPS O-acetylase OafA/YrhL
VSTIREDTRPQLDGLRTVAVAAVIVHHTAYPGWWGAAGVELFFVLSGFLITGILLRARDRAARTPGATSGAIFKAFYMRRMLRIVPLAVCAVGVAWIVGVQDVRAGWVWCLAYLVNVRFALLQKFVGPSSHFWSLAVEEQFYLFWPAVVLLLPRRVLAPATLLIIVLASFFRLVVATTWSSLVAGVLTPSCMDFLGAGALLAIYHHWPTETRKLTRWVVSGAVALGAICAYVEGSLGVFRLAEISCCVWIVHHAAHGFKGRTGRWLEAPAIVHLGTLSYGLYIWHNLVISIAGYVGNLFNVWLHVPPPGLWQTAYVSVVTYGIAWTSWRLFERRLNAMKVRFPYVPASEGSTTLIPQNITVLTEV